MNPFHRLCLGLFPVILAAITASAATGVQVSNYSGETVTSPDGALAVEFKLNSDYVQEFMKHVPTIWDDTKFIAGYPGKLAVLTRRDEGRWYVAGIHGEAAAKTITLDLSALPNSESGVMLADGDNALFSQQKVTLAADKKVTLTLHD